MITLIDLKKAKMQALKDHDSNKQNVLGVLIGSYQKTMIDKKANNQEMTDADMVSLLNKTMKELEDEMNMYASANRQDDVKNIQSQIALVKSYLPEMMSEDDIKKVIDGLADKSIKSIMVAFKTKYAGKADMGLVSKIAKTYQAK
ncbi:MAG: GatB/YqeY domain-containing protein [Bacilli bacterium]